jgi:membrane protease YdiL (CAAX protease family)
MNYYKAKLFIELVSVLVAVSLIVILFVMYFPYLSSSDVAIPIKILFELSPYILMVGLVIVVCILKKRPISNELGINKSHFKKQLLIAVIIFLVTSFIIIIPLLSGVDKNNIFGFKPRNMMILLYSIVKNMIFVGMGEELVWRGYFYQRLIKLTGSGIWAVVLSSILFGVWHYPIGQNILQVLVVTCIGLIYGFARLKVKNCSVLATGIAHGLHDTLNTVLGYFLL